MAEELFARRRSRVNQITEHVKKHNMPSSDRDVNRIRLNAVSHELGVNPAWSKMVAMKDNELSVEAEKKLVDEMKKTKDDLKKTIQSNGLHRFNTRGIIINSIDEEKVDDQPNTSNLGLKEHAQTSYQQHKIKQQIIEEENKMVNRHVAHHIHNTTQENPIGTETFRKMIDSTEHVRIDSQKEYLLRQHESMYQSKEYQDVIKRRKNISLCKGVDKNLSENETVALSSIIELNKDPFVADDQD
jgi:hypothetical protein